MLQLNFTVAKLPITQQHPIKSYLDKNPIEFFDKIYKEENKLIKCVYVRKEKLNGIEEHALYSQSSVIESTFDLIKHIRNTNKSIEIYLVESKGVDERNRILFDLTKINEILGAIIILGKPISKLGNIR